MQNHSQDQPKAANGLGNPYKIVANTSQNKHMA